jgi:hypothetical protein
MSILSALTFDTKRVTKEGLRRLNLLAAVLYFLEAIAVLLISNYDNGARSIGIGFLAKDTISSDTLNHPVLVGAARHLFDINLAYVIAAALLVATVAQVLMATNMRSRYEADLKKAAAPMRWMAYIFSFGIAMLGLSLAVGISDIVALGLLFVLTILAFNCARMIEKRALVANSLQVGSYSLVFVLLAILLYLLATLAYGAGLSGYVYAALVALCLWVASIYRNLGLINLGAVARDYMKLERSYLISSFIFLSLVVWLIYGATLR